MHRDEITLLVHGELRDDRLCFVPPLEIHHPLALMLVEPETAHRLVEEAAFVLGHHAIGHEDLRNEEALGDLGIHDARW
jgi:hypothetical protein